MESLMQALSTDDIQEDAFTVSVKGYRIRMDERRKEERK
jgi:hypothetical protein